MLEREYQTQVVRSILTAFPGAVVLKNDPTYLQGIPDWTVLYADRWAALEIKQSGRSRKQPNQDYYIDKLNFMSYAAFMYPENEGEVFDALQHTLVTRR